MAAAFEQLNLSQFSHGKLACRISTHNSVSTCETTHNRISDPNSINQGEERRVSIFIFFDFQMLCKRREV